MSYIETCWQEIEPDRIRFGPLGRMPIWRLHHQVTGQQRLYSDPIRSVAVRHEAWRGFRLAMLLQPWSYPCRCVTVGQGPAWPGILRTRVELERLLHGWRHL